MYIKVARVKLQIIQNNCLIFVQGVKLSDKKKVTEIHKELNIQPLNIRISKSNNKLINKCKEIQYPQPEDNTLITYKFSDYIIEDQPKRKRKMTIGQRIHKFILNTNHLNNFIKEEPITSNWIPPTPIITNSS